MKWMIKLRLPSLLLQKRIKYYIIWGTIAAMIDLVVLYIFTDVVGVNYMISQIIAFIISFVVGFWFQKYITFDDQSSKKIVSQGLLFLLFQWIGLVINLLVLYVAVEYWWIYYMIWSIIAKWIVFIWNFVMNYCFNFKS
jgi:putative flippase GtrA